jgi:hypothetical protein
MYHHPLGSLLSCCYPDDVWAVLEEVTLANRDLFDDLCRAEQLSGSAWQALYDHGPGAGAAGLLCARPLDDDQLAFVLDTERRAEPLGRAMAHNTVTRTQLSRIAGLPAGGAVEVAEGLIRSMGTAFSDANAFTLAVGGYPRVLFLTRHAADLNDAETAAELATIQQWAPELGRAAKPKIRAALEILFDTHPATLSEAALASGHPEVLLAAAGSVALTPALAEYLVDLFACHCAGAPGRPPNWLAHTMCALADNPFAAAASVATLAETTKEAIAALGGLRQCGSGRLIHDALKRRVRGRFGATSITVPPEELADTGDLSSLFRYAAGRWGGPEAARLGLSARLLANPVLDLAKQRGGAAMTVALRQREAELYFDPATLEELRAAVWRGIALPADAPPMALERALDEPLLVITKLARRGQLSEVAAYLSNIFSTNPLGWELLFGLAPAHEGSLGDLVEAARLLAATAP